MSPVLNAPPHKYEHLKQVLSRAAHFNAIPDEVQQAILESVSPHHFKAGEVIYLEGETAENVYILESGWVKATRMTSEGREQAVMILRPVEIFGDIAVFTGKSYPGTVVALDEVEVWVLPAQVLVSLVSRYPQLALAVIRRMSERVLHYLELVEDLSLRSVEARLAKTLLNHAELRDGQLLVQRHDWSTFDEIATRLGTVRDVLSRALKTLEADGLIRVEKQAIILINPDGLSKRVN